MTAKAGGIMVAAIGKRAKIGGAMARKAELGGSAAMGDLALALVAMSGAAPAAAGEAVLFAAALDAQRGG